MTEAGQRELIALLFLGCFGVVRNLTKFIIHRRVARMGKNRHQRGNQIPVYGVPIGLILGIERARLRLGGRIGSKGAQSAQQLSPELADKGIFLIFWRPAQLLGERSQQRTDMTLQGRTLFRAEQAVEIMIRTENGGPHIVIRLFTEYGQDIEIGGQWSQAGLRGRPGIIEQVEALYRRELGVHIRGELAEQVWRVPDPIKAMPTRVDDDPVRPLRAGQAQFSSGQQGSLGLGFCGSFGFNKNRGLPAFVFGPAVSVLHVVKRLLRNNEFRAVYSNGN